MKVRHKSNSIYRRLRRAFLLIIVLPVMGLGTYMVYSNIRFVEEERRLETERLLEQNVLDLSNSMQQCENSLTYAAVNYSFQEFLQMDETKYTEVYLASRSVAPMLYNIMLSNPYFDRLQIYTEKKYSVMNDLLKTTDAVKEEEWFRKTMETSEICWWEENGHVFLSKKIETSYPVKAIGILRADLKETLFSLGMQIFQNVPVRVMLDSGTEVYRSDAWTDSYFEREFSLTPCGWRISYDVNRDYFFPDSWKFIIPPVLVIFLVIVLALVVMHVVLAYLVRDVETLVSAVEQVRNEKLEIHFPVSATEELNVLAHSMDAMMERIRELIRKVRQDEQEQKELELELLRSKINPHFLYNNLSAINWMAIDAGNAEISEIANQMSAFYRSALNHGKTMDRLQLEITNIKAYISLQLIAHDSSFDAEFQCEENTLNCIVPTFILQPLVENALEHGIDLLKEKRGKIIIRSFLEEGDLVLQVEDNGTALFARIGNAFLKQEEFGYGTGNVQKRIQLVQGEAYGLSIMASEDGTRSELRLRADFTGIGKKMVL